MSCYLDSDEWVNRECRYHGYRLGENETFRTVKACLEGSTPWGPGVISSKAQKAVERHFSEQPEGYFNSKNDTVTALLVALHGDHTASDINQALESYLLFYIDFLRTFASGYFEYSYGENLYARLANLTTDVISFIDRLKVRYKARLLRKEQIRLVKQTLDVYLRRVEDMMCTDSMTYDDVEFVFFQKKATLEFFTNEEFRSERLELLILRYLDDGEEANHGLVDYINSATKDYRNEVAYPDEGYPDPEEREVHDEKAEKLLRSLPFFEDMEQYLKYKYEYFPKMY